MHVYIEKNITTVGTAEVQKYESYKFLSNAAVVTGAV
jgi:hypothetical protein